MEAEEEKVWPQQKTRLEGKWVMEMQEEETIWQLQSEVHSWFEKFVPEGKCIMEEKRKGMVPLQESKVWSSFVKSVTEKKWSRMEQMNEEVSQI